MNATVRDSQATPRDRSARGQIKRAWLVLAICALAFVLIDFGIYSAARFYFGHATRPETATMQVISGNGALIRSTQERDWRLVTGVTTVREGDEISTALGTVVWLSMFDGSTVEVSEDTILRVERMRSSRYFKRTKHFVVEPERGSVYVGVAPHGPYDYMEFTVHRPEATVTMADGDGSNDAGSFLVEVLPATAGGPGDGSQRIRAAVLRGGATVTTTTSSQRLEADQQAIVDANGSIGPLTGAVRELLQNGEFSDGLAGWTEFEQQSPRTAGITASGSSIEVTTDSPNGRTAAVVVFSRAAGRSDVAQSGIKQQIGLTLRVYSSLLLQFDAKISEQSPAGGGPDLQSYPLIVKIEYVDVQGQEREWTRGYYALEDPDRKISLDQATEIDLDSWQRVAFDLRSLSPLPKQITSILVYASGQSYETRVANISLTSSELDDSRP